MRNYIIFSTYYAKKGKNHEKYQQEYMARMSGGSGGKQRGGTGAGAGGEDDDKKQIKATTKAQKEKVEREQDRQTPTGETKASGSGRH